MVLYPQQVHPIAICGCFSRLHCDVTFINEADLQNFGPVDMGIAGWPCQGHTRARTCQCLEDPRSTLFWDLMQWWFSHQSFFTRYIFDNVPLLGNFWDKVLEGGHYVRQHLSNSNFVHAASIGSYAYQPR